MGEVEVDVGLVHNYSHISVEPLTSSNNKESNIEYPEENDNNFFEDIVTTYCFFPIFHYFQIEIWYTYNFDFLVCIFMNNCFSFYWYYKVQMTFILVFI